MVFGVRSRPCFGGLRSVDSTSHPLIIYNKPPSALDMRNLGPGPFYDGVEMRNGLRVRRVAGGVHGLEGDSEDVPAAVLLVRSLFL